MAAAQMEVQRSKRILMIITGGTICMRPAAVSGGINFSELSCSSLEAMLREMPIMRDSTLPAFDIIEWEELLDSSDVESQHWKIIAMQIVERYENYDGFVVLHGTDSLSFTASALSFIFDTETLGKTVVITGAMLPITHINSDALRNLTVSMIVAAYSQLNQVVVCFGTRILRGCCVVKTNCNILDPFDTPNCEHIGRIGIELTMNKPSWEERRARVRNASAVEESKLVLPTRPEVFADLMTDHVCVLRITPSFDPFILRQLAASKKEPFGLILQLYGTGTAPSNEKFQRAIEFAIAGGVTIVAVTQCNSGTCSLKTYANGLRLHQLGVIEGKDITTEAAFVKLAYLFGKGLRGAELRSKMEHNMRGELHESVPCITGQGTMDPVVDSPSRLVEENKHFKNTAREPATPETAV